MALLAVKICDFYLNEIAKDGLIAKVRKVKDNVKKRLRENANNVVSHSLRGKYCVAFKPFKYNS